MEDKTTTRSFDEKNIPTMTSERKLAHLQICLEQNVQSRVITTGLEDISFIHQATTDLNLEDVDLSTQIFGKKLELPLIISGMTGGHSFSQKLNDYLSQIAEKVKIGIGVGSQRAALEDISAHDSFQIVRKNATNALKIGNIGAGQIINDLALSDLNEMVKMIDADAIAFHFNPLQESIQPEGDTHLSGLMEKTKYLVQHAPVPIIAKEVGSGFSKYDINRVQKLGFSGIDVQGVGGTSWSGVESIRTNLLKYKKAGEIFWDWGIPTAISTILASRNFNGVVIGSGGVRTGLDIAKLIALGANAAGMALPFLFAVQDQSIEKVLDFIDEIEYQLRIACFLTGSSNLSELKSAPLLITGKTAEVLRIHGINPELYYSRAK
ncbi:MAG: type 2 isopentenyl-diphosphate Delta-isomerase [Candidatus Heimdallarchaeota archaeon]|nr:type 2 isopentenyl-diphosphate Delta-isomerase [Candidatus Heimdallarchaeota archaeon]